MSQGLIGLSGFSPSNKGTSPHPCNRNLGHGTHQALSTPLLHVEVVPECLPCMVNVFIVSVTYRHILLLYNTACEYFNSMQLISQDVNWTVVTMLGVIHVMWQELY